MEQGTLHKARVTEWMVKTSRAYGAPGSLVDTYLLAGRSEGHMKMKPSHMKMKMKTSQLIKSEG